MALVSPDGRWRIEPERGWFTLYEYGEQSSRHAVKVLERVSMDVVVRWLEDRRVAPQAFAER